MHTEKLEHSYPHCWRCHNPVIFRATEQWFISMEAAMPGGGTLRSRTLDEIKKVKWDPAWGEERISNMIATRPDWCISRQRVWGVPIAVFLCEGCGKPLNDPAINRKVVGSVRARPAPMPGTRQKPTRFFPRTRSVRIAAAASFSKETDIFDVWFESGSSYLAVIGARAEPVPGLPIFTSKAATSIADGFSLPCSAPWARAALRPTAWSQPTAGRSTRQGRAMSKSRGNDVDPVDIANRLGGEIVRLWVASVDFREDVVGSEQLMQRVAENYRKIRNTCFATSSAISTISIRRKMRCRSRRWTSLDQFMLRQTVAMSADVLRWYDEFAFHKIYHRMNDFCVVELSAFYFDVLKDRLYTSAPELARPPGRADGDLAHRRSARPPACAHH